MNVVLAAGWHTQIVTAFLKMVPKSSDRPPSAWSAPGKTLNFKVEEFLGFGSGFGSLQPIHRQPPLGLRGRAL